MFDWARKLQKEMRSSWAPVSAFFLVASQAGVDRLVGRMRALCPYGVTEAQIEHVAAVLAETLETKSFADEVHVRCELQLRIRDGFLNDDCCMIRNLPGSGFEVEVRLPGMIASGASGFLANGGFYCDFMPPSFYC